MTFFNFNLEWAFINGAFAMCGFLGLQAWEYKLDEDSYTWRTRKGDYIFGMFFIPLVFTFGVPYIYDYFDVNTYYNPMTSLLGGFLFDFAVLYAIKQAKKKAENGN